MSKVKIADIYRIKFFVYCGPFSRLAFQVKNDIVKSYTLYFILCPSKT